jgi:hypothetical protein
MNKETTLEQFNQNSLKEKIKRTLIYEFKDCCDCTNVKNIRENKCRQCFEDPARPFWECSVK